MSTEKFRTREQILASKNWSGEDTGRAYLYSLIAPLEGKQQIPDERLLKGVSSLVGDSEKKAYEGYKALYQFLTFECGQAQALEFAVKAEIGELNSRVLKASTSEDIVTKRFSESIKVSAEEYSKIVERTVQHITGEGEEKNPRFFDIDDIVDMIVYESTITGEKLVFSPDIYNKARELLGSELPAIKEEPDKYYRLLFNDESATLCKLTSYVAMEMNPQIDHLRDMTKAQRAALRDSLCKRISNAANYADYKDKPTMNSKFTEFREDMRARYGDLKISGLTLYYFGFSCFFLLARHTDTVFYDCERKGNGVAIIPGLPGVGSDAANHANIAFNSASTPLEPSFFDVSCNDFLKKWREENGLASILKKRSQEYKELAEKPKELEQSYAFLCSYNEFIDLIAARIRMPSLSLLKNDISYLEKNAAEYSTSLEYVYSKVTGGAPTNIAQPYLLTPSERRKYKGLLEELPRMWFKKPEFKPDIVGNVRAAIRDLGIFSIYPVNLIEALAGGESNEQ